MQRIILKLEFPYAFLFEAQEQKMGIKSHQAATSMSIQQYGIWKDFVAPFQKQIMNKVYEKIDAFYESCDSDLYIAESKIGLFIPKAMVRDYKFYFNIRHLEEIYKGSAMCGDIAFQFEVEIKIV
jgi:hypothetical protein